MDLSPPNRIVIDFLEGVANRTDAVAYARGFIHSHFDVPDQSGFYVMAYKDGYAFEVHEGGSRLAYLPGILRRIEESPDATVSIRSGARVLQVSKGARDSFNSVLLPEELSSYLENVMEPDEHAPHLIPYQVDNIVWLFWGGMMIAVSVLILIFAMGFYLLSPKTKLAIAATTPVDQLPISQWKKMTEKLDSDHYISQMKFENSHWSFEVLANDAIPAAALPVTDANMGGALVVMPANSDPSPGAAHAPPPLPATTGIQ